MARTRPRHRQCGWAIVGATLFLGIHGPVRAAARGIPRHGATILCDGQKLGTVTSGTFAPSLQYGIALGYVPPQTEGTWTIECNKKPVPAMMVQTPFYKGDNHGSK